MKSRMKKTMHRCGNCDVVHTDKTLIPLEEVKHLHQRLDPGSTVPSGECRECGAFCYPEAVLKQNESRVRLTLDVVYRGVDENFKAHIHDELKNNIRSAVGVGLLESDNKHTVASWDVLINVSCK